MTIQQTTGIYETLSDKKYIIGIDLGTTHCVLAYAEVVEDDNPGNIQLLEIPQVSAPGEIKSQPLLPSFLFLPGEHDAAETDLALPWQDKMDYAVGEYARSRGAELPARLVASAKSWLCHAGVDRSDDILPWDAPEGARRVSPLEATRRFLNHIKDAWNHEQPDAPLENQDIYLTVPASFDAVARELTVMAASDAGLEKITLLEEPTAAFYAWLDARSDDWRSSLSVGETILVCDVGGGTTDFSLIEVTDEDGELSLQRVAVGNHLLLGGDNMDLTLAYTIQGKLAQKNTKLDAWQFRGLWHSCRAAKEKLLNDASVESEPIVILGRGSSLIGGTIRSELTRAEIEKVLVEGFFPICEASDQPRQAARVGVREMGLPYEADPAITRHLAQFLSKHASAENDGSPAFPSAVLFNGGVMKAEVLRKQVIECLTNWNSGEALHELSSGNLDLAVGNGAAYYGLARSGQGIRVRAGAAMSYYIGVESAMPAVPGIPTPVKALCVVPFGMEEETSVDIREREFGLVVGETAHFKLLASSTQQAHQAGEMVEDWSGDIQEVTSMETLLPATENEGGGTLLPVWLQCTMTGVGTLEIWCVSANDDRRWKLEFEIRQDG